AVPEHARVVALVVLAAAAEEATSARGPVAPEDAVADRDLGHGVADLEDGADVLVADREPGLDLDAPVGDVEGGAADPGRVDGDDRVVRREQLRIGAFLDPDLSGPLEGDRAHPRRIL